MGLMTWSMVVTGLNVLLVAGLLYVYGKAYLRSKSGFTLGLLLFALLFFIQNLFMLYYFITMMPLFVQGLEGVMFGYSVLQALAFTALNFVSWR